MSVDSGFGNQEVLAVPDNAPSVSFDIRLGKKVDYIDFDYTTYIDHMTDRGVRPDQIGDQSIVFNRGGLSQFRKGFYSQNKITINVLNDHGLLRRTNDASVNSTLTHEAEHQIDDSTDRISKTEKRLRVGSYISDRLGMTMFIGDAAYQSLSGDAPSMITSAGLGLIGLSVTIYKLNPSEIRARKAQKYPMNVVSLGLKKRRFSI